MNFPVRTKNFSNPESFEKSLEQNSNHIVRLGDRAKVTVQGRPRTEHIGRCTKTDNDAVVLKFEDGKSEWFAQYLIEKV